MVDLIILKQRFTIKKIIYKLDNHFYAPEIEDRGPYCFCPVCHSVILLFCHSVLLSETLTLPLTFEQ